MKTDRFVLITVGSTKFDGLINSITSSKLKKFMKEFNLNRAIIQHGRSDPPKLKVYDNLILIQDYFEPELMSEFIRDATVIISHGGAGTIFEVLRNGENKEAFFVVVNEALMDSHQSELVDSLIELNCPVIRIDCHALFSTSRNESSSSISNFRLPPANKDILANLINNYI